MPQVRFEVKSCLRKEIRTTEEYWKLISEIKHPLVKRYEAEVKETIKNPDEVRRSKKDSSVFLYYKKYGNLFICVLVRHLNSKINFEFIDRHGGKKTGSSIGWRC